MTAAPLALEALLMSRNGFALVSATPTQRAICRVLDGLPLGELAEHDDVCEAFGGADALAMLPVGAPPAEVDIIGPVRGGKSLIAAALAVRATQTCDVSKLGAGEVPRVSIVSLSIDLGKVVFQHLRGNVQARPALRALLVGEPTTDALVLRHPSGRPVEIKVVAASRAGASLVARWSAGCVFDEAPRMAGELDGVQVNLDDLRAAVLGRLLDGAQIVCVGSPWGAEGPTYRRYAKSFGKPTRHVVIVRATGPAMNPTHWAPARMAALAEQDPRAFARDVLAEFGASDSAAFDRNWILAAVDDVSERPSLGAGAHVAALDASGGRHDAWALVLGHRELRAVDGGPPRDLVIMDHVSRWAPEPGKPLDFEKTCDSVASVIRRYGKPNVVRDAYAADAIESALRIRGVHAKDVASMSPARQKERFALLGQLLRAGDVRLVAHEQLVRELSALRERLHAGGRVSYEAPRGGFDDVADALALLVEAARKVAPSGGDIRNESSIGSWTGHGFVGGFSRWVTELPNGATVPAEPPVGTEDFEDLLARADAEGFTTPAIEAYRGERSTRATVPRESGMARTFECVLCGRAYASAIETPGRCPPCVTGI